MTDPEDVVIVTEIPMAENTDGLSIEQLTALAQRWPHVPAIDGEIYGFLDPNHKIGMAAMTHTTWERFLRDIQMLKAIAAQARAENILLVQKLEDAGKNDPKILRIN